MKKSRDVVGLPVLELTEGKSLGRVHSLVVNPVTRRVEALEIGERTLLKTRTEFATYAKLRSIGSDAVTLSNHEAVQDADENPELARLLERKIIGSRVVTVDGTLAGTVEDFSFQTEDGALVELYLYADRTRGHLAIPVAAVETFGLDFIIVSEQYREMARETDTPKAEWTGRQITRTLESRAIEFAVGRDAGHDVADEKGNIIVRKGEEVTPAVIEQARAANRLTQVLVAAGVGDLLEGLDYTREKLDTGSKKLLDTWQALRDRSHDWLARKLDEERPSPTRELRELWFKLQGRLMQGGRELEEGTRAKIRGYVLGKTLAHPVYFRDGAVLGARGDLVTEEMRDLAEQAGRLPQLFLSAASGDVQLALDPIKKQMEDLLGTTGKEDGQDTQETQ